MTTESPNAPFPIAPIVVGIGASAGGFDVITQILQHLPEDTGMAFVVVMHLAPEQPSQLGEVLANYTSMPVQEVQDGMDIQANHVYVIPPNAVMTISQNQLQLTPRDPNLRGPVKSINAFFESLARERENQAIAVVLSGSNDDGASGLQSVQAAGGITLVQKSDTAEFAEMPDAALANSSVDFILSPVEIAEELIKISRHTDFTTLAPDGEEDSPPYLMGHADELAELLDGLLRHTGVDFKHYKSTTFERRLRRRMTLHKFTDFNDYLQLIRDNPEELSALYQDILISVTSFFRDPEVFDALKQEVFPHILQHLDSQSAIRIWVPGCATGEEVYSIAISLLEYLESQPISPVIQIFGTDINEQAIEEARIGFYRPSRMDGVSPERRQQFFVDVEGGYQINRVVREICVFAKQDLSSDPPFSALHLVSCRNVLIYFQPELQRRILSIFHYSLLPEGLLSLGSSESVGDNSELFTVFDARHKIYARTPVPSRLNFDFITSNFPPMMEPSDQRSPSESWSGSNIQQWADQIVLNRYGPVGVVVNEDLEILQFRGETAPYLRPAPGNPSFNLLKMIRPSLLLDTRNAIEQVKQRNIAVRREGLPLEEALGREVNLEVIPFNVSPAQGRCFLVLFESPTTNASPSQSSPIPTDGEPQPNRDPEVLRLREELATVRQELLDTQTFLQLSIEEQEATNQRLIAANEEILSSNEELKSTNEELQTAKEEIQSANEELKTTNEELQERNAEAIQANDDLENLLSNINIPILMVSEDLLIRRFTPVSREIFNLIPSDVGRPVSDIRLKINTTDLEAKILAVIETLTVYEEEVQGNNGGWYLLRIRPYRTIGNRIDGAVLKLLDISNLKNTLDQLEIARNYAESIVETVFIPLVVLDQDLRVKTANQAFYDLFALTPPSVERCSWFEVDRGQWNLAQLQSRLENLLAGGTDLRGFEVVYSSDVLDQRTMRLNARRIAQVDDAPMILLSIEDITDRKAAEAERIQLAEARAAQALAEANNARQNEFFSVLSHELRTPLSSILGWLDLIKRGSLSPADYQLALEILESSANAQLRLIDDLLDVSRIIQGRLQLRLEPTNLTRIAERAIAVMQPSITEKQIRLITALAPSPVNLSLDPQRIQQVLVNLLSNAVKFTPEAGEISIRLTYGSDEVQIQVQDNGQGIDPEVLPHIFDSFYQGDASITRKYEGLGLGLSIVKYLVEAHNGTIQAESPGMGNGTVFTVTLPKVVAVELPPLPTPQSLPDDALAGYRILVVDDDPTNLVVITMNLELYGATVITANSAAEALEQIAEQPPDLLISDISMPQVNGYELMQQIRSLSAEAGGLVPAIALTAYAAQADAEQAIAAGFQRHISKPFTLTHLVGTAYNLLQSR